MDDRHLGHGPEFLERVRICVGQCLAKASIETFSLSVRFPSIEMLAPDLDTWLDLAMKKSVSKLTLKIGKSLDFIPPSQVLYSIPKEVLGANTLVVLDLHQCKTEDQSGSVNLPHLGKLSLNKCHFVGESLIQKIVSSCPIIEDISIIRCIGVGHFLSVSCKPQLKKFEVNQCNELKKIEIDAPNLHKLSYNSSNRAYAIDMSIWSSVKKLELGGRAMVMQLEYLLSKFHCIEVLKLSHGPSRKFKISSATIKRLVLRFVHTFPDAKIEAPNLHILEFSSTRSLRSKFKFSSWNVPKLDDIDMIFSAQCFYKACKAGLEEFLIKVHNYEDLKIVMSDDDHFVLIEKLHRVSFTCLRRMVKVSNARNILISSRETSLVQILGVPEIIGATTIYMMCSSPETAEVFLFQSCLLYLSPENGKSVKCEKHPHFIEGNEPGSDSWGSRNYRCNHDIHDVFFS